MHKLGRLPQPAITFMFHQHATQPKQLAFIELSFNFLFQILVLPNLPPLFVGSMDLDLPIMSYIVWEYYYFFFFQYCFIFPDLCA